MSPRVEAGNRCEDSIVPPKRGTRSTLVGLVLLAFVALALRVALVLVLRSDRLPDTTYEHGVIANHLLEGRGFRVWFLGTEGLTSQQAPFYPFLLAGMYWLFGGPCPQALLAMQLLQCFAGMGLVFALVWLAWQWIPQRREIGWFAGVGAALYPTHLYMVSHIQVVVWAALGLVLALGLATWAGRSRRIWPAILAGTVAGWLILIDPILVLALPAAVWCLWRTRSESEQEKDGGDIDLSPLSASQFDERHGLYRRFYKLTAFVCVAALLVAPWILRNVRVHGEFVFVKSTFGYAFWQGNNPVSWGTDKVPKATADRFLAQRGGGLQGMEKRMWEARHETLYIDDVLLKPTAYAEFQGLSEPERSRLLCGRAMNFIRENPSDYLALCLQRLRYFLLFDETNPKTKNLFYRAATLSLLALSVLGLSVGRPWWRATLPAIFVFASVTLFHTLTITSARFRIPVEPFMILWAAIGVAIVLGAIQTSVQAKR